MSCPPTVAVRQRTYFCLFCCESGVKVLFTDRNACERHYRDKHFSGAPSTQRHGVDLWIERHLKYQESVSSAMARSPKSIPDRSKTLYRGCPVCDVIIEVYSIRSDRYLSGVDNTHEIVVRDLDLHYSGNTVNHINPHLRYYPYECLLCESESETARLSGDYGDREVKMCSVRPMMRIHVKEKHFKNSTLTRDALEAEIEKSIRTIKVDLLEKLSAKFSNKHKHTQSASLDERKSLNLAMSKSLKDQVKSGSAIISGKNYRPIAPNSLPKNFGSGLPTKEFDNNSLIETILAKSFNERKRLNERMSEQIRKTKIQKTEHKSAKDEDKPSQSPSPRSVKMNSTLLYSLPNRKKYIILNMGNTSAKQAKPTDFRPTPPFVKSESSLKESERKLSSELSSPSLSNLSSNRFDVDDECELIIDEEVKEVSIDGKECSQSQFACVFCRRKFAERQKTFAHYLSHFGVYLQCAKCSHKFDSLSSFRAHDSSHNHLSNLVNFDKFKCVHNWIDTFLDFFTKKRAELIKLGRDVTRVFCPVCAVMYDAFQLNGRESGLERDESLETHLHRHLNYFPNQCVECRFADRRTGFCLDDEARKHLTETHGIRDPIKDLAIYFDSSSSSIDALDSLVKKCVEISREMSQFWNRNASDKPLNVS